MERPCPLFPPTSRWSSWPEAPSSGAAHAGHEGRHHRLRGLIAPCTPPTTRIFEPSTARSPLSACATWGFWRTSRKTCGGDARRWPRARASPGRYPAPQLLSRARGPARPGPGGRSPARRPVGCTTINVMADASADGRPYLAQTYDMERYYRKYLCLLRLKPEKGPEGPGRVFAGILGPRGVNSAGWPWSSTRSRPRNARPGVIYPFIARKALAAERIGDAWARHLLPSGQGLTYQLSGPGAAFCAETSGHSLRPP
jgi:hypothetical protein